MKLPAKREKAPALVWPGPLRGIVAVAATYGYFLIFTQFGFLRAVSSFLGEDTGWLRPILAVMGAAGMAGCGLLTRIFQPARARLLLVAGFGIAGSAAGLTGLVKSPAGFLVAAGLTGLGTAIVTVGLATTLRRETGGDKLGPCVGLGTGLAYAVCNLPPVFTARPVAQAMLGLAAAGLGLMAVTNFKSTAEPAEARSPAAAPRTIAGWVLVLGALVALDSAVFYHIQHTASLLAATWTGSSRLLALAATHLLMAVATGYAVRRRPLAYVTLSGAALLLAGTGLILGDRGTMGALLYAAGVSVYSTVLVYYPARQGRVGLSALVFAFAGWLASALGLGLAHSFS